MHAYILPQAADSKFLRIYWYTPTYKRFTSMTVWKYVPSVSLDHVQFFSMRFLFFFFADTQINVNWKFYPTLNSSSISSCLKKNHQKEYFIIFFQDLIYLVHPAYLHGNWEVERSFDRCFCCFMYSVTLVVNSLMPFGINESSLDCTAIPPKDLSSVSVDCNSAGDLDKCKSKKY